MPTFGSILNNIVQVMRTTLFHLGCVAGVWNISFIFHYFLCIFRSHSRNALQLIINFFEPNGVFFCITVNEPLFMTARWNRALFNWAKRLMCKYVYAQVWRQFTLDASVYSNHSTLIIVSIMNVPNDRLCMIQFSSCFHSNLNFIATEPQFCVLWTFQTPHGDSFLPS